MPRRLTAFLMPTLALCLTGCGTVSNFVFTPPASGEPMGYDVYGGVQEDVVCIERSAAAVREAKTAGQGLRECSDLILWAVDLPLSAIGDTVTLPLTVRATIARARATPAPGAKRPRY
jgi:uncharacterized protein YceK